MDDRRFEELMARYEEGEATPEELAELESLIRARPSCRQTFVKRMVMEVHLRKIHSTFLRDPALEVCDPTGRDRWPATRRRYVLRPAGSPRPRWPVALTAACVAAAFVGLALVNALRRSGGHAPNEAGPAALSPRPHEEDPQGRESRGVERHAEAEAPPAVPPGHDRRPEAGGTASDEERRRIEAEMKEELERARQAFALPGGAAEKPPERSVPVSPPAPPGLTTAALGILNRLEGEAHVVGTDGARVSAREGQALQSAQGLHQIRGRSQVRFQDGTELELATETVLKEIVEDSKGKRITLERGTLEARVRPQPPDRLLVIATPHAEAKVLGTTLRIDVAQDPKEGTKLVVEEGRVRLKNLAGKTLDVPSGHYAVAAVGVELLSKPLSVVAHWEFEEEGRRVRDSSGQGHDGEFVAGGRAAGKIGRALRLNGRTSYVEIRPCIEGTGPFSVTAWIRTTSAADQIIVSQTPKPDDAGMYQLAIRSGGRAVWSVSGRRDPGFQLVSKRAVHDGNWHYVVGVREKDGTGTLYIDGKPEGASLPASPVKVTGNRLFIGAEHCCLKEYFSGLIDDVRIYDRVLPPEEVGVLAGAAR